MEARAAEATTLIATLFGSLFYLIGHFSYLDKRKTVSGFYPDELNVQNHTVWGLPGTNYFIEHQSHVPYVMQLYALVFNPMCVMFLTTTSMAIQLSYTHSDRRPLLFISFQVATLVCLLIMLEYTYYSLVFAELVFDGNLSLFIFVAIIWFLVSAASAVCGLLSKPILRDQVASNPCNYEDVLEHEKNIPVLQEEKEEASSKPNVTVDEANHQV